MKCSVVIVAAGSGKRMKSDISKQYLTINEKPILAHTIDKFENCSYIDEIIVVVAENDISYCKEKITEKYDFKKVRKVVSGGNERQVSVFNGLKEVDKSTDIILIHDGVRPFIKNKDIIKIIEQTRLYKACVIGVKVKDTVKICDENNNVLETPDRKYLWAAQTPQAFFSDIIISAYKKAFYDNFIGTDDCMIVERTGIKVKMIEGSYDNIKITTPEDLLIANAILQQ